MERKSLLVGVILAMIFPGAGMLYVGRIGWFVFFILMACLGWLMIFTGILAIVGLPLWIFSIVVSVWATAFAVRGYNRRLA